MKQLGLHGKVTLLPKLPAYTARQLVALTVGIVLVAFVGFLAANQQTAEAVGTWLWNPGR